jgi:hypothetical protein
MKTKELELSEKIERRLEMIHTHPKLGKRMNCPKGRRQKKNDGEKENNNSNRQD